MHVIVVKWLRSFWWIHGPKIAPEKWCWNGLYFSKFWINRKWHIGLWTHPWEIWIADLHTVNGVQRNACTVIIYFMFLLIRFFHSSMKERIFSEVGSYRIKTNLVKTFIYVEIYDYISYLLGFKKLWKRKNYPLLILKYAFNWKIFIVE